MFSSPSSSSSASPIVERRPSWKGSHSFDEERAVLRARHGLEQGNALVASIRDPRRHQAMMSSPIRRRAPPTVHTHFGHDGAASTGFPLRSRQGREDERQAAAAAAAAAAATEEGEGLGVHWRPAGPNCSSPTSSPWTWSKGSSRDVYTPGSSRGASPGSPGSPGPEAGKEGGYRRRRRRSGEAGAEDDDGEGEDSRGGRHHAAVRFSPSSSGGGRRRAGRTGSPTSNDRLRSPPRSPAQPHSPARQHHRDATSTDKALLPTLMSSCEYVDALRPALQQRLLPADYVVPQGSPYAIVPQHPMSSSLIEEGTLNPTREGGRVRDSTTGDGMNAFNDTGDTITDHYGAFRADASTATRGGGAGNTLAARLGPIATRKLSPTRSLPCLPGYVTITAFAPLVGIVGGSSTSGTRTYDYSIGQNHATLMHGRRNKDRRGNKQHAQSASPPRRKGAPGKKVGVRQQQAAQHQQGDAPEEADQSPSDATTDKLKLATDDAVNDGLMPDASGTADAAQLGKAAKATNAVDEGGAWDDVLGRQTCAVIMGGGRTVRLQVTKEMNAKQQAQRGLHAREAFERNKEAHDTKVRAAEKERWLAEEEKMMVIVRKQTMESNEVREDEQMKQTMSPGEFVVERRKRAEQASLASAGVAERARSRKKSVMIARTQSIESSAILKKRSQVLTEAASNPYTPHSVLQGNKGRVDEAEREVRRLGAVLEEKEANAGKAGREASISLTGATRLRVRATKAFHDMRDDLKRRQEVRIMAAMKKKAFECNRKAFRDSGYAGESQHHILFRLFQLMLVPGASSGASPSAGGINRQVSFAANGGKGGGKDGTAAPRKKGSPPSSPLPGAEGTKGFLNNKSAKTSPGKKNVDGLVTKHLVWAHLSGVTQVGEQMAAAIDAYDELHALRGEGMKDSRATFKRIQTETPGKMMFDEFRAFCQVLMNEQVISHLFESIDADGNQELDIEEILDATRCDPEVQSIINKYPMLRPLLNTSTFHSAFAQMDADGSGTVDFMEFKVSAAHVCVCVCVCVCVTS